MSGDKDVIYRGFCGPDEPGPKRVTRDGKEFSADQSQRLFNHSPDGFNWGYGGSGPAQLALALLTDAVSSAEGLKFHQDFKRAIVAALDPQSDWSLTRRAVRLWWLKQRDCDEHAEREGKRVEALVILEGLLKDADRQQVEPEAIYLAIEKAVAFLQNSPWD